MNLCILETLGAGQPYTTLLLEDTLHCSGSCSMPVKWTWTALTSLAAPLCTAPAWEATKTPPSTSYRRERPTRHAPAVAKRPSTWLRLVGTWARHGRCYNTWHHLICWTLAGGHHCTGPFSGVGGIWPSCCWIMGQSWKGRAEWVRVLCSWLWWSATRQLSGSCFTVEPTLTSEVLTAEQHCIYAPAPLRKRWKIHNVPVSG